MNELKFSQLPDSELCKATIEYARLISEPFLFHHVMRSAVFADMIGRQRKMKFDPEILCVATVLHDLGLTKLAAVQARFELEGADAAKEFLAKSGLNETSIETVWEAIALHTTPEIPLRRSPEVTQRRMTTMPMIDIYAAAGTFSDPHKLAAEAAATVKTVEAVPDIPMFRKNTAAFVHDLPQGAISNVDGDSNYVRVQVLTNQGALSREKQLTFVEKITEA